MYGLVVVDFFCKQKTAYEMRISDLSSDVCSSDLKSRQIVAADPHERTCAALARDGAGMRESIAHLPQRNNIVRRWHIQGAGGSQCMQGHGGTTPDADAEAMILI